MLEAAQINTRNMSMCHLSCLSRSVATQRPPLYDHTHLLVCHRTFVRYAHTAKEAGSSPDSFHVADLDMVEYHRMVDSSLDEMTAQLEELLETEDIDKLEEKASHSGNASEWDVEYAVRTRDSGS